MTTPRRHKKVEPCFMSAAPRKDKRCDRPAEWMAEEKGIKLYFCSPCKEGLGPRWADMAWTPL
jgi:hypothetical protein